MSSSVDSILVNGPDTIVIDYDNSISDISISYDDQITNISVNEAAPNVTSLSLETGITSLVYAVDGLQGNVVLSNRSVLGTVSPSSGVYSYLVNHSLNVSSPVIAVYNTSNQQIFCDVELVDSNSLYLKSLIDMQNYKVVVQR